MRETPNHRHFALRISVSWTGPNKPKRGGLIQLARQHRRRLWPMNEIRGGRPYFASTPHPGARIPFSQPLLLPSFQPLFPSFLHPHPGEASSLPHYSDVITPPSDVTTHVASTFPRGQRPPSFRSSLPFFLSARQLSVNYSNSIERIANLQNPIFRIDSRIKEYFFFFFFWRKDCLGNE